MEFTKWGYCVDFVLCIDATGGMAQILDKVKELAVSFMQSYVSEMEETCRTIDQLRAKVIAFRDYTYHSEPMVESEFFVLPEQNAQFTRFLTGIKADGGGDLPENALEALALALKSDWTTEGSRRRQIILLFTDAPAAPSGTGSESPLYPEGMPRDLAQLTAWWEGTDPTFTGTYQPRAGRLVAFAPNAFPWTEMQAWNRYWPAFSLAGTDLPDLEIRTAVDLLVGDV